MMFFHFFCLPLFSINISMLRLIVAILKVIYLYFPSGFWFFVFILYHFLCHDLIWFICFYLTCFHSTSWIYACYLFIYFLDLKTVSLNLFEYGFWSFLYFLSSETPSLGVSCLLLSFLHFHSFFSENFNLNIFLFYKYFSLCTLSCAVSNLDLSQSN